MDFGLCHISVVPLRAQPSDVSEMVSQILYGETFQILDRKGSWSFIKLVNDNYEGWIDTKQFFPIIEDQFSQLNSEPTLLSTEMVDIISTSNGELLTICMGSQLNALGILGHAFEGSPTSKIFIKDNIVSTAINYLNSPYLWGGKTPFGIDCSGFVQMVYKLNGHQLLRDASQQAQMGEPLSFIEECKPGDLAFFDNEEGKIIHVGIMMKDNYIIHAHGKVRVDRIDHSGIFNNEMRCHTHKLRVLKRIL